MQTISHEYENVSPIFDEIERYYSIVSEKQYKKTLVPQIFDGSFMLLDELFYTLADVYSGIEFIHRQYDIIDIEDNNNMIVCFSGGKDSIATALYYIEQGYNVYLYHMRHINPPLSDEYIHAQKIAEKLGLPIRIDSVKLSGFHDYVEHPMKNMIIANGALNYGIREGIGTNIAFGNYLSSSVEDDNFEFCGGDDTEMWCAYNDIIQRIIPDFMMNICLHDIGDSLEKVCYNKNVLDLSVSCICRANLRNHWHNWAEEKYHIKLPKNRCGRCYKCCLEYIWMTDHDLQEYNRDYYEYCLSNLKRNLEKEGNSDDVWNHYFFYDKSESKYFS